MSYPPLAEGIVSVVSDEEENIEKQPSGYQPSSFFKKAGAVCLTLAIIVAVILVCLTPRLNSLSLSFAIQGRVFFALIGVFIFFLFSCLYCTYYLGGSKDSWEIPEVFEIRLNFTNITAITGLVIEFIQICSFAFNAGTRFTGANALFHMTYLAVPFKDGPVFRVMYWIMFGIAFSPYVFVVCIRTVIYLITRHSGEAKAAEFVLRYQQQIYSILWLLVNTLYFPVISTLMSGLDCTFSSNGAYLDEDPRLKCLGEEHIVLVICSLLAFIVYYPAASFAQSQTQNISDIKFKPKYSFIFVQGKVILAAMNIFFTSYPSVYLGITLFVELCFLLINVIFEPCLVQWINRMRTIFFSISAWTAVCAVVDLKPDINPNVPLALLILGWILLTCGFPLFFFLYGRFRSKTLSPEAKRKLASTNSGSTYE